jgi:hypothetical protein
LSHQVANAKLLDALRSRMLDVGASRPANRIPSLQLGGGENNTATAAILQTISTQLEVQPHRSHLLSSDATATCAFVIAAYFCEKM